MQTNLTCFLHKKMGSGTLMRFWIKTQKRCNLWIESGVHRSSSIPESPTHVAWSTNLPVFASDSPQFSSRKLRWSSAQRDRQAGRQAGREGGRERGDRARAAFEIFRSCPNQRPGICTDDFFIFFFFGPFLFSFLERWEVSHPGNPPKKKKKKLRGKW